MGPDHGLGGAAWPSPGVMNVWIAAIAEVHDLTVVTRNAAQFVPFSGRIFNPWDPA